MAVSRTLTAISLPVISIIRSKEMFSSCLPFSSFVAGVKIGSGRRSDSTSPFGRGMPHTSPCTLYSAQPEPER